MPWNRIDGTAGNDTLIGTDADDFMTGRGGNDQIRGEAGDDTLVGGAGNDTLVGDDFTIVDGGADLLIGGEGDDNLIWRWGDDTLVGGDGNDFFDLFARGSFEQVSVHGGDGVDSVSAALAPAVVNLEEGTLEIQGASGSISLHSIENFQALNDFHVHVTGSSADNWLTGGNRDDTLIGGLGRDTLDGWGAGDDRYVLNVAPGEENADLLIFEKFPEFNEADEIALDSSVMTELGATGQFAADDERFHAAAGATGGAEADDRVIYDTDTGRIYYDADGSGSLEAQLIAEISAPGLMDPVATDFTII